MQRTAVPDPLEGDALDGLVRALRAEDIPICDRLLAGLPDWFGIEESNREYIGGLSKRPSAVAERSGRVAGFVSVEQHGAGEC